MLSIFFFLGATYCGGLFTYTKAYEIVGKGVGTDLVGIIPQANLCASQACPMLRQLGNGTVGWAQRV